MQTKLITEILQLAYLVHAETKYCVFIDFSGHVNSLTVSIRESKQSWQTRVLETEFYVEYKKLLGEGRLSSLAELEAKRNILARIINEQEIPVEDCSVNQYLVEDYTF